MYPGQNHFVEGNEVLLNLTDYAKHRGCYPRAVEAAIAAGRIHRDERGLIDADTADRDWAASTNPYRSAASRANGRRGQEMRRELAGRPAKPVEKAEAGSGSLNENPKPAGNALKPQPNTDISEYARSRAQREHYQAENARLSFEQRQGKLLDRERIESVATESYRIVRDMVLAVPDRLPELSGDDRARLQEELHLLFERDCRLDNLRRSLYG